jgi:hypothetical protein
MEQAPLIDADAMIAPYRNRHGLPPPATIEETVAMHVAAMDEWLADLLKMDL